MPAQDHPNNAPGVPMLFPPLLERLQIKYFNPMARPIARYLPTFAVIKHRGRKSGVAYETVVNAFRKKRLLVVMLTHGKTNWVKNVLAAGEAEVQLFRREVHITNPRVLAAGSLRRSAMDCSDGGAPGRRIRRRYRLTHRVPRSGT